MPLRTLKTTRLPESARPRVVVCGTRWFDDYAFVKAKMDYYTSLLTDPIIVTGGRECRFDDTATRWALAARLAVKICHPDEEEYGLPAAYHVRNREMIQEGLARPGVRGMMVAFWDGQSSGTRSMIEAATKKKYRVIQVNVLEV